MTARFLILAIGGAVVGAVVGALICGFVLHPDEVILGAITGAGCTILGYIAGAAVALFSKGA